MHVISTWNAPSATYFSEKLDPTILVIAKSTRIELVRLLEDGVRQFCGIDLWGQITSLNVFDDNGARKILVTTDHPRPMAFILRYNPTVNELEILLSVNLYTRGDRPAEFYQGAVIHQPSQVAVSMAYKSTPKVIPLSSRSGGDASRSRKVTEFDARIPELSVVSICFLPPSATSLPLLAMLYIDNHLKHRLIVRAVNFDEKELSSDTSEILPISPDDIQADANLLIPIDGTKAGSLGGILVVGGGIAKFLPCQAPTASPALSRKSLSGSPRRSRKSLGKGREDDSSVAAGAAAGSSSPTTPRKRARGNSDLDASGRSVLSVSDMSIVEPTAYTFIDERRILIGDAWGKLSLLALSPVNEKSQFASLKCIDLPGDISAITSLTYLTDGIIYIGSHYGNSQIARLLPLSHLPSSTSTSSTTGTIGESPSTRIEVLDEFTNVGPIMDALLIERDGGVLVVTASGSYNSGSLRIMNKSAEFVEQELIEPVNHVQALWPLKALHSDQYDHYILLSSLYDTQLISIDSSPSSTGSSPPVPQITEVPADELPALDRSLPTIAAGNVKGGSGQVIVQVTAKAVRIVDLASGFLVSSWSPSPSLTDGRSGGRLITTASVNPTQMLVALEGGNLVYLRLDEELKLIEQRTKTFSDTYGALEISSVSITPMWHSHPHSSRAALVSFWGSNSVRLLDLATLESYDAAEFAAEEGKLPMSLLLHVFDDDQEEGDGRSAEGEEGHGGRGKGTPFALVGLADGHLVAYELDRETFRVKSSRTMLLGNAPLRLSVCMHAMGRSTLGSASAGEGGKDEAERKRVVFVSGSRPTVLFLENGRLQHSPMNLKDVQAACPIHVPAFPNSLALSRKGNIVIGHIDKLHDLQVRTIKMNNSSPVCLAHDPVNEAIGLGIIQLEPKLQTPVSVLRIVDDASFEARTEFKLPDFEEITAVMSCSLSLSNGTSQYWVIGTELIDDNVARRKGSVIVCTVQVDGVVKAVAQHDTVSGVGALASIDGRIVVAAGPGITIFKLVEVEEGRDTILSEVAKWERGYEVNGVHVNGDKIFISDSLRSIEVLKWSSMTSRLSLVARDHSSLWPISSVMLSDKELMVAEGKGHVYSYVLKDDGSGLERAGSYYIGEVVTTIKQGSVVPFEGQGDVHPKVVFFTSTGRIGVISSTERDLSFLLTGLERNLSHALPGPGGLEHSNFRAPVNTDAFGESAQTGFIDGDFVEKFLDHSTNLQLTSKIMEGKNAAQTLQQSPEDIAQALEKLRLLH